VADYPDHICIANKLLEQQGEINQLRAAIAVPEDMSAALAEMIANLQSYIDRRAAELAAPHIAAVGIAAGEEVADAQAGQRRAEDLVAELRRHISALERRRDEQRQRAEQAEAAVVRGLAAIRLSTSVDLGGRRVADGTSDYQRGYQECADRVTKAMNGTPDQQEADHG
jgi:hypothetical protein